MSQAQVCGRSKSLESSGKPDAWKLACPVWGWGRGVIPRPTPPFQRVFGKCEWAVMCIIAQDNKTYTRLRFNVGPGGQILIPLQVDYSQSFGSTDKDSWEAEYMANIKVVSWSRSLVCDDMFLVDQEEPDLSDYTLPQDILEQMEDMEPAERKVVLDELAVRPDLWEDADEIVSQY